MTSQIREKESRLQKGGQGISIASATEDSESVSNVKLSNHFPSFLPLQFS